MFKTFKHYHVAFLAALPMGLMGLVVGAAVADLQDQRMVAEQRTQVTAQVSVIRARLEGILEATSSLTVGLSNVLEAERGHFDAEIYDRLARRTMLVNHHIRSVSAAPGDIVNWIYPREGNLGVIGLRLAERHDQVEEIVKARLQRQPVLAGPFKLVEGGVGLIFRIPIYLQEGSDYWGVISIVTHIDTIIQAAGVGRVTELKIGVRKPNGEMVAGDASAFSDQPVMEDVHIPGGMWQLAAAPAGGWVSVPLVKSPALYVGLAAGTLLSGILGLLGVALRHSDRHNEALQREVAMRREAQESLKLAGAAFASSGEAILVMDADLRVVSVNAAFGEMSGFTEAEIVGGFPSFLDQRHGDGQQSDAIRAALRSQGKWRGEIVSYRKGGDRYPAWITVHAVPADEGENTRYVAVCSDISVLKQTEQELDRLAHFDILTALPNRLLFRRRLVQDIAVSRDDSFCALLLLDIDGFKGVNDSFGHYVGDRLLRDIADRLLGCVGARDTVARLGGDEFAVILTALDSRDTVIAAASRIVSEMQLPFVLDEMSVSVSVSVGIACCPEDGADEVVLTRNADAAMYAAKEAGRSTYRFYQWEMTRAVRDRLLLEQRMREGLVAGHFEVWFQPRVCLQTRRIVGAEGLVRWRDPERGLISPADFIPVAERSGLILALGDEVIDQVIGHAERWHARRLPFGKLSMNVATPQIERGDLAAVLRQRLQASPVPPDSLEVEVTESLFMTDAARARSCLNDIRDLGLSIAIDDFGTGYSSLAYLKTLPVNHLKIDRAFVRDLPLEANDKAIVRAIISMSRSMGFRVTAEGVETEAQRQLLADEGCDEAQGFLFYKPMPAADYEALIAGELKGVPVSLATL